MTLHSIIDISIALLAISGWAYAWMLHSENKELRSAVDDAVELIELDEHEEKFTEAVDNFIKNASR
jgi:hypothetical protein